MAGQETWGTLPKAQDDATTIDSEISAAIAAHNADPDAHTATGQALDLHRVNEVIDHPAGSIVQDKFVNDSLSFTTIKAATTFENSARFTPTFGGSGAVTYGTNGVDIKSGATVSSFSQLTLGLIGASFASSFTFSATVYVAGAVSGNGKAAFGVGDPDASGANILLDEDFVGFLFQKVGTTITIYGVMASGDSGTHTLTAALGTCSLGSVVDLIVRFVPGTGAEFYIRTVSGGLIGPVLLTTVLPALDGDASLRFAVSNQATTKNFEFQLANAEFER